MESIKQSIDELAEKFNKKISKFQLELKNSASTSTVASTHAHSAAQLSSISPPQRQSDNLISKADRDVKNIGSRGDNRCNLIQILMHSNATLIRSGDEKGYSCALCSARYSKPANLKRHFLNTHTEKIPNEIGLRRTYSVKVDITDLKCTICDTCIPTLQALFEHLKDIHNKKVYTDIQNHLVSYKFDDDDVFRCAFCDDVFRKFRALTYHMNVHYRNYVCDVCNAGFINNDILRCHKRSHKGNAKNTEIEGKEEISEMNSDCNKNIEDSVEFVRHEDINDTLTDDAASKIYICSVCDAVFLEEDMLENHVLNEHSIEKKYTCDDCNIRFLTLKGLQHHQKNHKELKKYQCYLCLKSYNQKQSLNDHLLTHADDVGFGCAECDRSFTKEADRREHVAAKHGYFEKDHEKKGKTEDTKRKLYKNSSKIGKRSETKIKFRANVLEVLYNSNASTIRNVVDYGFTCCFCTNYYERPEDLKKHNLESHDKDALKEGMWATHMNSLALKVDITDLRCTLCDTEMSMLDDLMSHLIHVHNRPIHSDIDNYMVPLKFEDDTLRCTFCRQEFAKFKSLMEHINVHYRNYVCEVCDRGFIGPVIYRAHRRIHITGHFKCNYCDKVMDTNMKKLNHERVTHGRLKNFDETASKYVNKCQYCNISFNAYHKKQKHLVEVHGVKMPDFQCKACDRTFPNRQRYTIHIRRDHLLERKHKCTVCDKKFFTSISLKHHMLSHSGLRKYQCDICMKCYGRKSTLREHLRIHANDRKYVCKQCGQSFVQKCSWVGHMRAKHWEIV